MRFSVSKVIFLTGIVSLFALPSINKFILVHLFLIIALSLLIDISISKKILINKSELVTIELIILYFISTIIGALISKSYSGIITSFLFILTFVFVFLAYKLNENYILIFLKGFIISAIITSIIVYIDTFYYYLFNTPLWLKIIPEHLAQKAGDSYGAKIKYIWGIKFYRSAGLSWDPGISMTGVTLAIVLLFEKIVNIKNLKFFLLLMFGAVILSISRTAIYALVFYFFIKSFEKVFNKIKIERTKVNLLTILAFIIIVIFLNIGIFIEYNNASQGTERHLKYFSSLYYFYKQNFFEFLFGYGYTGVGIFFNKYVDWLYNVKGFYFKPDLNPESTLTNIWFYGGLVGSFFWIYLFFKILLHSIDNIKIVFLILILLSFGYAINSVWFNAILFVLIFWKEKNFQKQLL